jgi:hypothetical protein
LYDESETVFQAPVTEDDGDSSTGAEGIVGDTTVKSPGSFGDTGKAPTVTGVTERSSCMEMTLGIIGAARDAISSSSVFTEAFMDEASDERDWTPTEEAIDFTEGAVDLTTYPPGTRIESDVVMEARRASMAWAY